MKLECFLLMKRIVFPICFCYHILTIKKKKTNQPLKGLRSITALLLGARMNSKFPSAWLLKCSLKWCSGNSICPYCIRNHVIIHCTMFVSQ